MIYLQRLEFSIVAIVAKHNSWRNYCGGTYQWAPGLGAFGLHTSLGWEQTFQKLSDAKHATKRHGCAKRVRQSQSQPDTHQQGFEGPDPQEGQCRGVGEYPSLQFSLYSRSEIPAESNSGLQTHDEPRNEDMAGYHAVHLFGGSLAQIMKNLHLRERPNLQNKLLLTVMSGVLQVSYDMLNFVSLSRSL